MQIGKLIASFEAATHKFDAGLKRVESGMKSTAHEVSRDIDGIVSAHSFFSPARKCYRGVQGILPTSGESELWAPIKR